MKRRRPLKANPEKVREFMRRAQQNASLSRENASLKRSDGLKRAGPLRGRSNSSDRPKPVEGPLTPFGWRQEVWRLDGGRCRGCGLEVELHADSWVWQAHHCVPKERLRRESLHLRVWDPGNGIVLCTRCHGRHESRIAAVPLEKLPARVSAFAQAVGDWCVDVLHREHPRAA